MNKTITLHHVIAFCLCQIHR